MFCSNAVIAVILKAELYGELDKLTEVKSGLETALCDLEAERKTSDEFSELRVYTWKQLKE